MDRELFVEAYGDSTEEAPATLWVRWYKRNERGEKLVAREERYVQEDRLSSRQARAAERAELRKAFLSKMRIPGNDREPYLLWSDVVDEFERRR